MYVVNHFFYMKFINYFDYFINLKNASHFATYFAWYQKNDRDT